MFWIKNNDIMAADPSKPKNIAINLPDPKVSIISVACRICYDNEKEEELISPCRCKVSCHTQNKHVFYHKISRVR